MKKRLLPDRWLVYQSLIRCFSNDELEELCFFLGIDWEDLSGQNKSAKARSLVRYCEQRKTILDLLRAMKCVRPI